MIRRTCTLSAILASLAALLLVGIAVCTLGKYVIDARTLTFLEDEERLLSVSDDLRTTFGSSRSADAAAAAERLDDQLAADTVLDEDPSLGYTFEEGSYSDELGQEQDAQERGDPHQQDDVFAVHAAAHRTVSGQKEPPPAGAGAWCFRSGRRTA